VKVGVMEFGLYRACNANIVCNYVIILKSAVINSNCSYQSFCYASITRITDVCSAHVQYATASKLNIAPQLPLQVP